MPAPLVCGLRYSAINSMFFEWNLNSTSSSFSIIYEAAISDIKELQKAQEKLSSTQKEQIENPNKDLSSDIADAVSEYKRLSDTVKDFRENVYDAEKSQKELTDNKQFKEYNSAWVLCWI